MFVDLLFNGCSWFVLAIIFMNEYYRFASEMTEVNFSLISKNRNIIIYTETVQSD